MFVVRPLLDSNWEMVKTIYKEGIDTGLATFETEPSDWDSWDSIHLAHCRLLAQEGPEILGWAALSPVSDRCVYGGVAEVSVYVSLKSRGRGIGLALLNSLVNCSESKGYWTLQAGIFTENKASIRLHEKAGY
jgi:L-amino acid N-acyltransferase YncA